MALPLPSSLPLPARNGARRQTQQKADWLLRAAAEVIAEQGFEATSLRDVGRRLGVSLGGMYYYFTSKDDLLFQIQHRTFGSLLEAQESVGAATPKPVDRLRALLAGHLAFFAQHPNEMKICTYELESLGGERYARVLSLRRRYYRVLADAVAGVAGESLAKGRESTRGRHLTLFIFGMLNWAFMWYQRDRDGSVEALADEMMGMLLHGIGRRRS
jgi:AcrR family transcriptional regulator